MNIEPGVESVIIPDDLYLGALTATKGAFKKTFPDVKELVIGDGVHSIFIPNTLFPNVKKVISKSMYFRSGKYLVRCINPYCFSLLNVFCQEDEIDLKGISIFEEGAFAGCKSISLKNTSDVTFFDTKAFIGSAFMEQPFLNGVKMAGNLVIAVDDTAEEVVIPDYEEPCVFAKEIDLSKIQKLVIHNKRTILKANSIPKCLVYDSEKITKLELEELIHLGQDSDYLQRLELTERVEEFKEVDGVIYDKAMREVIACSLGNEIVKIPEGVKSIGKNAFSNCWKLKAVKFPNSLMLMDAQAFCYCKKLEQIDFGKGLSEIGPLAFSYCSQLKKVTLPPQMRYIRKTAFHYAGLESIELNNGLLSIEESAFLNTHIKSIRIPGSVRKLGFLALGLSIESIRFEKYLSNCLSAFTYASSPELSKDKIIKLECYGKTAYIPKYIKPGVHKELEERLSRYLNRPSEKLCELWKFAYSKIGKENTAIIEYEVFSGPEAKAYIKKNARRIATRLMEEGDEEKTVSFLKLGLVPKTVLKTLVPKASELGQMTVEAYLLELSQGKSKQNFSL